MVKNTKLGSMFILTELIFNLAVIINQKRPILEQK